MGFMYPGMIFRAVYGVYTAVSIKRQEPLFLGAALVFSRVL
jgi:hypothetical protein